MGKATRVATPDEAIPAVTMPTLIIASTSTRAGKTSLTAAVATYFSSQGKQTVVGKFGGNASSDLDAADLAALLPGAKVVDSAGQHGATSPAHVATMLRGQTDATTVAVLEGVAGDVAANLALAEATDGLVILIARFGDEFVPIARAYGGRLAGVVLNAAPRYRAATLSAQAIDSLSHAGIKFLGAIPEDRILIAPSVKLISDHVGGHISVLPELGDRIVENFLIGGLVLDWAPHYFGSQQNTCVVVRGDRPDVQLAAVQTETTRAMVLTKGISPIEYVHYEATQRNVPIVVSPHGTHETAAILESLAPKVRFNHPDKLARMVELVRGHVDLVALERAIAQPATR